MKNYTALLLVVLISVHAMPIDNSTLTNQTAHEVSPKATGLDLSVTDVDFSYPNSNDRNKYQMFSSNYPIAGFNKPESLYVVDAVKDVEIEAKVFLSNSGTVDATNVEINILDIQGRKVRSISSSSYVKGLNSVTVDANDLSSGIYFVELLAEDTKEYTKIMLLK